jgi:AraC-like DNA-binding protein
MSEPKNASYKEVSPEEWLDAIANPQSHLSISRCGYLRVRSDFWLKPRRLPDHVIWLFLKSRRPGVVAEKRVRLEKGDVLWISPETQHYQLNTFRNESPLGAEHTALHFLHLRLKLADKYLRMKEPLIMARNAWELAFYFDQIARELQMEKPFRKQKIRAFLMGLFAQFFRLRKPLGKKQILLSQIQQLRLSEFMHKNATRRPSVTQLAKETGLSQDYFSRVFRKTFGVAPKIWLKHERLRMAASQLEQGNLSVKEVAYEFGYHDANLFSRQFRQVFGENPSTYRKIHVMGTLDQSDVESYIKRIDPGIST